MRHAIDLLGKGDTGLESAMGQEVAETGQRGAQIMAMYHHVDHAVIVKIFGALEAVR